MRVFFLRLFTVLMFMVLLVGCSGSGDPPPGERLQASIDANWNNYKYTHSLPGGGMAVYLETPTGNYFASSGMAAGVDQNTRFRIASNTKTFTASAIMLLYQQGKLDIDDFITSNIPGTPDPYVPNTAQYNIPNKASITIKQLLSHTAGVFDVTNDNIPGSCAPQLYAGQSYVGYQEAIDPNHQFTPDELVGVDATCQLSYFLPGTDYKYSNTGYSLLAIIIERVSGLSYDQFILQNLIVPNALASTTVPMLGTDQTIPSPFNPGYIWFSGAFEDVTESNMSANIAEGNIISTPANLARWIKRLITAQAGPNAASVTAMTTPTPQSGSNNYGLGISYTAGLGYGHEGAHVGYLSLMDYDSTANVTTILYFNVWDYANLRTDQGTLLQKAAKDARAAVGY
jgi:D-alanyl-D-alanine carboxypeptidase